MTKFVVFVCIFLVTIADHGAQTGFVADVADKAIEKAEQALAAVKETTDTLSQKVRGMANMTIEGGREQVTGVVDMVDNKILEIIGTRNHPRFSECAAKLSRTLHDTADAKVVNASHCAVEKLDQVDGYILVVYNAIYETLAEIKLLKEKIPNCTAGGWKNIIGGTWCIDKAAFRAGWLTAKKIPEIILTIGKIEAFIPALPPSLTKCVVKNGVFTFVRDAGRIMMKVKECASTAIRGTTT